jgi:hypothetical protein
MMRVGACNLLLAFATVSSVLAPRAEAQDTDVKFKSDFRLRYENNNNLLPNPARTADNTRSRAVVRFRTGIAKNINEYIGFGARLTTGDPNDPNTADVTLGNFLNDLTVSLDRAYLDVRREGFYASGGKFANPFRRTDLVWDGDVNPQGAAASYALTRSAKITPKLTGIFFIIDEFSSQEIQDSRMGGGQLELGFHPRSDLGVTVAGGYYDYDIDRLGNGDEDGDARSNNIVRDENGDPVLPVRYVSDFDLLDIIGVVEHRGFSERYPIRLVGDYVKNLGANVPEDQGFMIDLFVGKTSKRHDTRFRYGYSQCERDAVLAAFSNDNTTIPTNYEQHTVTADYVVLDDTTLNVTWYYHRELDNVDPDRDGWVSRIRLNAVIKF